MISESALNLLEFPKVLRIVASFTHSEPSEAAVLSIRPLSAREDIIRRLHEVAEVRRLAQDGDPLRLSGFPDIAPLLGRVRPEGAFLDAVELAQFMPFLSVASDLSAQISTRDDLTALRIAGGSLTGFPDILGALRRSLDSEGNILDTASFLLGELRTKVRRLQGRVRKRLEEIMRDERVALFLQDSFVTERSGRWVIPVRMDSKGMVPGVVHDVSRSGDTAFIEPMEIIGISNELENLVAEQKAEEIRILRELCSRIRAAAGEIGSEFRTVVHLDLLNAVARFADELSMESPQVTGEGRIALSRARHPLLAVALKMSGEGREVVPLDMSLGGDRTVMVITGSNAGGKTIAIKTIGLLIIMALAGMPVPADGSSVIPSVDRVLVDIGDEQSIEQNLSTFSAHVSNIAAILRQAGHRSLVLIDELGTGTDPAEGSAIACAVLQEVRKSGALLFATTHLTDIKGFVHRTEGMVNAAMEFDRESLSPLYRLRVGEPGQSHALDIARRYGLPDNVVESARRLLGGAQIELDRLIADLTEKRAAYEQALADIERERKTAEERNTALEERLREAEGKRIEALARAYEEAEGIIVAARRQMSLLLEEARQKDRSARRDALRKAEAARLELAEKRKAFLGLPEEALAEGEVRPGETVFVKSLGCEAEIIVPYEKQGRIRVRAGSIEVEVPLSDIRLRKGRAPAKKTPSKPTGIPDRQVEQRLNLVGLRVDEALSLLEPYLNQAALAGIPEVTIIHGFGTGALSRAVREHLKGHPLVKGFRSGEQQEGGGGVTVATLR